MIRKITGTTITTVAATVRAGCPIRRRRRAGDVRESERPNRYRSGRARQPLHRGHGKQSGSPGGCRFGHHHHLHGRHRRHSRHLREIERAQRAVVRCQRRTVYRRFEQRTHRSIRPAVCLQQFRRQWGSGLQGRWRPGDHCPIEQAGRYHDGRRRKHLRRRREQQPDPQDSDGRHDHHHRRQGRSGLQRRWRKRYRGGDEFPAQRGRQFRRQGLHRRHRQSRDSNADAGISRDQSPTE